MAAQQGRDLLLKLGDGEVSEVFTTIAGLTNVTYAFANGTLDVTTFDDDGVRQLLSGLYGSTHTFTGSGISDDDATINDISTQARDGSANNYQIVVPGSTANGTFEGSFIITSFELTGETDGAINFSITLESAGAITFA